MTTQSATSSAADSAAPGVIINIAVDAAYLASQQSGPYAGTGIYMMDNGLVSGCLGEGGAELSSVVNAGFGVAFNVNPIQMLEGNYTVQIAGIELSSGTNIFGNRGFPAPPTAPSPYQWLGTATEQGSCIYQIKIGVQGPDTDMVYFWWDPKLTCVD
ncbi:hypothetical protein [Pseudoduganella armeniaca]|uniref:Inclusion body protein n=1 Tax=Pseudoduganella armeniaca TaxID=2072590 RepID=A0A2R4CAH4_9BURK|nr:hypothetical protein [Pseudoduganella armeniaca]AVR96520.1 hypothetical protein C9I28_13065 [Pseudoduganella armeniaca]